MQVQVTPKTPESSTSRNSEIIDHPTRNFGHGRGLPKAIRTFPKILKDHLKSSEDSSNIAEDVPVASGSAQTLSEVYRRLSNELPWTVYWAKSLYSRHLKFSVVGWHIRCHFLEIKNILRF